MNAIALKFWFENDEKITRTIVVRDDQTFADLQLAILNAVNFDNEQLSSFKICNSSWDEIFEISLIDMDADVVLDDESEKDVLKIPTMDTTLIGEHLNKEGVKLVFEYDFLLMWRLRGEVIKVLEATEVDYPILIASEGAAPNQYDVYDDIVGDDDGETKITAPKSLFDLAFEDDEDFDDEFEDESFDFDELSGGFGYDDKD